MYKPHKVGTTPRPKGINNDNSTTVGGNLSTPFDNPEKADPLSNTEKDFFLSIHIAVGLKQCAKTKCGN